MAKERPIIGIAGDLVSRRAGNDAVAVDVGFADQVSAAGGTPIVLPPVQVDRVANQVEIKRLLALVGGVIVGGNGDVTTGEVGECSNAAWRPLHPRRQCSDRALIQMALSLGRPLLCVGAGMHLLNVVAGGTLYSHLPADLPRGLPHADGFDACHRHRVFLTPHTRLEAIYGEGDIQVNGQHHRGVRRVGAWLRSSAVAPDGLVEGIEAAEKGAFVVGVQWHPESQTRSALDLQLFEALVKAARLV